MRKAMVLAACLAIACVAAGPRVIKLADPFPGNWAISLIPNGTDANKPGVKGFDETLTFTVQQMTAKVMATHGFGPAPFDEDTRRMGPATFTCTQTSDKEGTITWQGLTTGQDLTGTMTWTKKDGSVIHYDYQGSKAG
jgi:hypothetical protein